MQTIRRRYYQSEALDASRQHFDAGVRRQLLEMTTGSGKTRGVLQFLPQTYADVLEGGQMVMIFHQRDLVLETAKIFRDAYPDRWIGVEMGEEYHATGLEDFLFLSAKSVGTLTNKRRSKVDAREVRIVVTDEGHHVIPGSTWDRMLNHVGVGSEGFTGHGAELSLFLTATPNRHDGRGLYPVVDEIVYRYPYVRGVRDGYLVDGVPYELSALIDSDEGDVMKMARVVYSHGEGHQTLAYFRRVRESQLFVETINRMGFARAAHIDGSTDDFERDEALIAYREGHISVLSNVGVFLEGTDLPTVDLILDAAPTKSHSKALQKFGRGVRPHGDARVDDFPHQHQAEERRAAIHASPKPHLMYVAAFDPTVHPLTVISSLTGHEIKTGINGKKIITEIKEKLDEVLEARPEQPILTDDFRNLEIVLKQRDFWNRNVYNEKAHALSKNAWVFQDGIARLYLPENPFTTLKTRKKLPVIVSIEKQGEAWRKRIIEVGGYNDHLKIPVGARVSEEGIVRDPAREIRAVDQSLEKHTQIVRRIRRGAGGPMRAEQIRYMKRNQIAYTPKTTEGTADLLIAQHRTEEKVRAIEEKAAAKARKKNPPQLSLL